MSDRERLEAVQQWLRYAREDLERAEAATRGGVFRPRHGCWYAQQAAEKALKAALVFEGVEVPRSHDLDLIRNLIPPGWSVKNEHPKLGWLAAWATKARYVDAGEDPSAEDAADAAPQARSVFESVLRDLRQRGFEVEQPERN